ncbi:MAG: hypothetical protein WBA20_01195 [Ketobacter sp.]
MNQQIAGVERSALGKEAYDLSPYRPEKLQRWISLFRASNAGGSTACLDYVIITLQIDTKRPIELKIIPDLHLDRHNSESVLDDPYYHSQMP